MPIHPPPSSTNLDPQTREYIRYLSTYINELEGRLNKVIESSSNLSTRLNKVEIDISEK